MFAELSSLDDRCAAPLLPAAPFPGISVAFALLHPFLPHDAASRKGR